MPSISMLSAPAGGGRFTPLKPTLTYAGSGVSNMGKFIIGGVGNPYDSTYIYTITSGVGSVSGNILTVSNANASVTLTARAPKGLTSSTGVIAERKAPTQGSYFVETSPTQCYGCGSPGFEAPCCAPGPCGCGTFHNPGAFPYSGFWACCNQGYTVYFWNDFRPSYTWGGSDYNNGQGEWWKIV